MRRVPGQAGAGLRGSSASSQNRARGAPATRCAAAVVVPDRGVALLPRRHEADAVRGGVLESHHARAELVAAEFLGAGREDRVAAAGTPAQGHHRAENGDPSDRDDGDEGHQNKGGEAPAVARRDLAPRPYRLVRNAA